MLLLDYLNDYEFTTNDDMAAHFMERFGVNVKVENDLYLFKYGQLEAKWLEKLTHECRGVILRKTGNNWKVVSRPFNKFFNVGEGHCPVNDKTDWSRMKAAQKLDGTCAQIYFDEVENRWRMSTLGTITTTQCSDSPWTFEELFWKVANKHYSSFVNAIHANEPLKNYTIICELCTEENRILTRYDRDRIFLLGCRNKDTGELESISLPLDKPFVFDVEFSSVEDAKDWVESESKKIDVYGEFNEGFVLYNDVGPIGKMKNSLYVQLHHAVGAGDTKCTRNRVIEAFFCGNMDDVYPVLTSSMQEFADKLGDWWRGKIGAILEVVSDMKDREFDTVKDFALHVKGKIASEFQPFFFQNKLEKDGKAMLGPVDSESVSKWMTKVYKKFEAEMKELSGV